MKKIKLYLILSHTKEYSCFLEKGDSHYSKSIKNKALHEQNWKPFNLNTYVVPEFELISSDTGKEIISLMFQL